MRIPRIHLKSVAHEAHEIAGYPSMGHSVAAGTIAGTVASVAGYQANSKLSKHTNVPSPTLGNGPSKQTGGMPVVAVVKYTKPNKRKGGKRK